MKHKNPLIEPENYFDGYKESIEQLKNRPELVEFDRLCYDIFAMTEDGKRWIELVTARYLIPSLVNNNNAKYETACIWSEGFKETHAQRKKMEMNKE
jgi:hypothetical protein